LSWWVALVLPVLSLISVALSLRLATTPAGGDRMDVVGAGLLTAAAAAVLVLIPAPALGLGSLAMVALAALAVTAASGHAGWVRRRPSGFVPRALMTSHGYLTACVVGFGVFGGLFVSMFAAPQLLIRGHDWTVLAVGAVLLPGTMLGAVTSRLAGRLSPVGARRLLALAAAAAGLVLGAAGITGGAVVLVVTGTSLAFVAFALTQAVLTGQVAAGLAQSQRGSALGLLNLTFMVGGAVGSATAHRLAGDRWRAGGSRRAAAGGRGRSLRRYRPPSRPIQRHVGVATGALGNPPALWLLAGLTADRPAFSRSLEQGS